MVDLHDEVGWMEWMDVKINVRLEKVCTREREALCVSSSQSFLSLGQGPFLFVGCYVFVCDGGWLVGWIA